MKKGKLHNAERHAVLAAVYAKGDLSVDNSNVGAYRTKTVKAGEFLYVSCYPLVPANIRREQDAMLTAKDGEMKQGKLRAKWNRHNNMRRSWKFEQLVHANFGPGDFHVCCTYEVEDWDADRSGIIDRSREDAKRDIRNYLARLKRLLKKHGCDPEQFRWISCTVTKESMKEAANPRPDSHHHHLLISGIPEELRTDAERLWNLGYCNADRLQDDRSTGIAAMAGYIARQEGSASGERAGEKSYSCSRNIIRPEERASDAKISRRRVSLIAADVRANAREIFEKCWPGYRLSDEPKVLTSEFVAGAYIYARLRIDKTKGADAYGEGKSELVRKARNL